MARSIPSGHSAVRISDEEAIMGAVMNAQYGGAKVGNIDAVAGASLGVEGIIEAGRKALQTKNHLRS